MTESKHASDADLIREFQHGNESTFDELFARYRDGVYSLAYRTLGPAAAEDAAQDVFVHVYKSLHSFRGDAAFKTWLYRLGLNVFRDHIRRQRRRPPTCELSSDLVDNNVVDDSRARRGEMQVEVESALLGLTEEERSLLELHYIQGFSHREISEMLQCNHNTVRTRVHRAIAALRRKLLPALEEAEK